MHLKPRQNHYNLKWGLVTSIVELFRRIWLLTSSIHKIGWKGRDEKGKNWKAGDKIDGGDRIDGNSIIFSKITWIVEIAQEIKEKNVIFFGIPSHRQLCRFLLGRKTGNKIDGGDRIDGDRIEGDRIDGGEYLFVYTY